MAVTSSDEGRNRNPRRRLSPEELRFLNGQTDEVAAGVLSDHEMWLATDAPAEALIEAGLIEDAGDVDLGRGGLLEEARWRLADQHNAAAIAHAHKRRSLSYQGSTRTTQRRMKRYREWLKNMRSPGRPGPQMSVSTAADRIRSQWEPETGTWSKTCVVCGKPFTTKRSDKMTCTAKCRKRKQTGARDPRRWLGDDYAVSRVGPPPHETTLTVIHEPVTSSANTRFRNHLTR